MALRMPRSVRLRGASETGTTVVRVDRRTKNLTKRLQPGEIAVIDHEDIDRVSADALVSCKPAVVVNASRSISGRYPNQGPELILGAGIPIIDAVGPDVMTAVREGDRLRVADGALLDGNREVARGTVLELDQVRAEMVEARSAMSEQIEHFATNTMDYLRKERDLLIDGVGVPEVTTDIDGRHALIVVRGHHYREDLAILRSYIREYRPVLIGVDGGADAIIEAGLVPDLVVGDMDSVSDRTLRCGAEIIVHAYRDGRAPGAERVRSLGVEPVIFSAVGTSEDIAMLLADDKGADLIVAVGTHATLEEFLDKGRSGMSSTFLTRLRVGSKLVDAKGVSRLYRPRIRTRSLAVVFFFGFLALLAALYATPAGQAMLQVVGARMDAFWDGLRAFVLGVFS
ncbi:putative cytokinetic ring protein SteA [Nostocoides sp. F2B08]|uniref:putative cytokinetic ring protein SteA n=1 Tax=Nostocoides sp. F2B08 TaxID=2653936 RepID=UPI003519DF55